MWLIAISIFRSTEAFSAVAFSAVAFSAVAFSAVAFSAVAFSVVAAIACLNIHFFFDQASARSIDQIKRRQKRKQNELYQPYHVIRTKQQISVIYSQFRFVDEFFLLFTFSFTIQSVIVFTATVSEFRVYALPHAKIKRWHITQQTLLQYQREFDERQLSKDILSKKFDDNVIYTNRKDRNYNNVEREFIHKSGWKKQHGIDSSYAAREPH